MSEAKPTNELEAQTTVQAVGSKHALSIEEQADWLSSLFLFYLNPLFVKGTKEPIGISDLGTTSYQDKPQPLYVEFMKQWEVEKRLPQEQRSLWYALWRTVGYGRLFLAIFYYAGYSACSFGPVLILTALVNHFSGADELTSAQLWILVSLMFVLPLIGAVLAAHSNIILAHVGVQFRNALVNAIYRKSLTISSSSRQQTSTGQIINMFSNDTAMLQRFLFFLNNLFLAPFTIGICLYLIYEQVGVSTFVGLGLIIVSFPLNGVVFNWLNEVRKEKVKLTDKRIKTMNEILNGVRVIKFYAWEEAFQAKIAVIRDAEVLLLKKIAYIVAIAFSLVLTAIPVFMPVLIFYTYVELGNQLDATKAFTALALFNLIQFPFVFLPLGLSSYNQSTVACGRIMKFLDSDDLVTYITSKPASEVGDGAMISMSDASFSWSLEPSVDSSNETEAVGPIKSKSDQYSKVSNVEDIDDDAAAAPMQDGKDADQVVPENIEDFYDQPPVERESMYPDMSIEANTVLHKAPPIIIAEALVNRSMHTLTDISFSIRKGELVAVVGAVGSGKSSLLNALLGEMLVTKGSVELNGSVAFCDQRPWILNDTVQNNVTFGLHYDENRFDSALHYSSLEDDIIVLPGGINTQIGERGINLSGGQKARVAFARAIYRDADVYILDDVLSAVDAHVGQFIFHEGIRNGLAGKTRVLVTHQVHLLPFFDKIIILHNGCIKAIGNYAELQQSGVDIQAYIPQQDEAEGVNKEESSTEKSAAAEESKLVDVNDEGYFINQRLKSKSLAAARKGDGRESTISSVEEKKEGDVTLDIYTHYIMSGGLGLFLACIFFVVLSQVCLLLSSFWLSYWGEVSRQRESDGNSLSSSANIFYLQIFAALSCAVCLCYLFRSILLANHRLVTSTGLHENVLKSVLSSPIAFFDVTPVGRILNRFSTDMQVVDDDLLQTISQGLNGFAQVVGAVGAIAGATKGTFLILVVPMAYFYDRVQKYFRATNTALARIESISRSPIYADFSQALNGVGTIRAFSDSKRFIDVLEKLVESNSVANMMLQLSSQWLSIRLDTIGALISFFIAALAAATSGFIPPGFLALGLVYSFQLTTYLKFLVRMISTMEAQMSSVERIKYYTDFIEKEGSSQTCMDPNLIPATWPEQGAIHFKDISMRYRDGPLVLKTLNALVNSTEKVGLAGRTGSGKSSLMIGLFRFQELSEGSIMIDNIDISQVPLKLLRSRLGIIPQDPVMFSATVRFNLDPFEQYSDLHIWQVLEDIHLKDHILSLPGKLSEMVAEGGDNFSAGQRQLICIGRAILRKPKILILDEATASIDNETDAFIQVMIRSQFKDSTVLTIAHRLNTIIDCDRIMVLNDGNLVEYDSPEKLIALPGGVFSSLWAKHLESHSSDSNA